MSKLDFVRGITRPTVTWLLVAVQVALALVWALSTTLSLSPDTIEGAFSALAPFTMMAMTFWFVDRNKNGASQ